MIAVTEYIAVYQFEFFDDSYKQAQGYAYQHALSLWTQECRALGIIPTDIGQPDVNVRSVSYVGRPSLIANVPQEYRAVVEVKATARVKIVREEV